MIAFNDKDFNFKLSPADALKEAAEVNNSNDLESQLNGPPA